MAGTRKDNSISGPAKALERKIAQIIEKRPGERDMYAYLRDLLTDRQFGIGLDVSQVVVDSPAMGVRDAPDLAVYLKGPDGQPIRTADHCIGVIEAKQGDVLRQREAALLAEKRKYVQTGTKAFYLCDQVRIVRWDASPLGGRVEYLWSELRDPPKLSECFGPISADRATLRVALDEFRSQGEPYALFPIGQTENYRELNSLGMCVYTYRWTGSRYAQAGSRDCGTAAPPTLGTLSRAIRGR